MKEAKGGMALSWGVGRGQEKLAVDFKAVGGGEDDLLRSYPSIRSEDIEAALHYAAELARERIVPLAMGA